MNRFLPLFFTLISWGSFGQQAYHIDTVLMGSSFAFTAVSDKAHSAENALQKGLLEVIRIENLISSWDPNSETSEINRNAGIEPTKVSNELFELIRRAKKISELSNGYFDISFASIDKAWDFSNKICTLPEKEVIEQSVALIDFQKIILNVDETSVFLKEKGMKIGFGAIGKGYAAEQAKKVMFDLGIQSGVINAGGDLIAWGSKENGDPWGIGIQDPDDKNNTIMWIPIHEQAVVTSGNYERFIEINGERYCHIIDPKTGWPVKNLKSVTLICSNAELADALATTVFVLGTKDGLQLINKLVGIECIIVDENNEIHFSKNIDSNYAQYSTKK